MQQSDWHHVAMVYDGSKLQLYLDGKQEGAALSMTGDESSTHDDD